VTEVYRQIDSGRLMVLGRAGSGKSVLTIRFVLDYLDKAPSPGRVPVVFSLGAWDPAHVELRDWLIDRLRRDHPYLSRRSPGGPTLAAALVDADLILPVLDGFDEMAPGLRRDALETLNETPYPMVLTSRRDEFSEAVRAARAPLVWAAGIELTDLTVDDLADYLPRTARTPAEGERGPAWEDFGTGGADLTVNHDADGRLEVFASNGSGVFHRWQTSYTTWSDWADSGSGATSSELASSVAADGRIEVFAINAGTATHLWQTAVNGVWSSWATFGTGGTAVDATENQDGHEEVFAASSSGVHHIWQTSPTAWASWQYLATTAGPSLS
jgi:hypothetical protein